MISSAYFVAQSRYMVRSVASYNGLEFTARFSRARIESIRDFSVAFLPRRFLFQISLMFCFVLDLYIKIGIYKMSYSFW